MKPHYIWTSSGPVLAKPTRVPYPQTIETCRAWLHAYGVTIAWLARANGMSRWPFVELLIGRQKGLRGASHRADIILGLKPEPKS